MNHKSNAYADGESDGCILPTKCPNNGGQLPTEGMEGRQPIKENIGQATAPRTRSRISELSDLLGVRKAAREGSGRGSPCSNPVRTCHRDCGTPRIPEHEKLSLRARSRSPVW